VEVPVHLWFLTVVMDGYSFVFQLKKLHIYFPPSSTKKIGDVPTCRQGGANMLLLFKIRQHICAASHLAPSYWCCKDFK
jgi:hypothetical protein